MTTPTDPNSGFTPNLAQMIKTSKEQQNAAKQRPDSGMSFSSTATTSYSYSISEADSGLSDVGPLSSAASTASGFSGSYSIKRSSGDIFPRLEARVGTGFKTPSNPVETPSKRTKKTDKTKLLRTVSPF